MSTTENKKIHGFSIRNAIKSFFVTSSVELAQEALDQHNGKSDPPKPETPKK